MLSYSHLKCEDSPWSNKSASTPAVKRNDQLKMTICPPLGSYSNDTWRGKSIQPVMRKNSKIPNFMDVYFVG